MLWNQYGSSIGKADAILRILSVSDQSQNTMASNKGPLFMNGNDSNKCPGV